MTVKEFVDGLLCVPVTRVGNRFIIEAIEIVLDSREHKFYEALSDITHQSTGYLERAIRVAKDIGLNSMGPEQKIKIFGENNLHPQNTEYIIKAADYYRRNYEDKES